VVQTTLEARYRGALFGLAVGDALGTTLESVKVDEQTPKVTDIVGGGKYSLLAGQWTDDTSMMLCLATSIIECKGFDPKDQLRRYNLWYKEGNYSSNGQCFDIGITSRMALEKFVSGGEQESYPASTAKDARAGNGSLMRLAPVPLYYRKAPLLAMQRTAESSLTTHGAAVCVESCKYFTGLLLGAMEGASKEELLSPFFLPSSLKSLDPNYWEHHPFSPEVEAVVKGSYKSKNPPEIQGSGYVVGALESVLWAFYHTENFVDGLLKIVNIGNDADTTGAIYGQLAGCFYGVDQIPSHWKTKVTYSPLFQIIADELLAASEHITPDIGTYTYDSVSISSSYQQNIECLRLLETSFKPILRKILPGPHTYKTIEAFKQDCTTLESEYQEKAPSCECKAPLLADFKLRLDDEGTKLHRKLSRPANPFAKGFPPKVAS